MIALKNSEKTAPRPLTLLSRPEHVFLVLALVFGLVFVFLTPPALVGDEPNHFFRAYQISEGRIIGEKRGDLSGGWLPESVLSTHRRLVGDIEMNHDVKFDTKLVSELMDRPLEREKQVFERFPNTVVYTPVPYLPQVFGIAVGKVFDASPLKMIYLARVFNLLAFIALAFWAIRRTPICKWVFCLLCLTPTTIFQSASASVDAFTYAVCFLTIAEFLYHALGDGEVGAFDLGRLFLITLLAVLSKQAYILLPLLFLLVPRRKIGSTARYLLIFSALVAVCVIAEGVWSYLVKPIYLPYRVDMPISPDEQAAHIINHPLKFIYLALENYFINRWYYFKAFFGQLVWLDLFVPTYLIVANCGALIVAAVYDNDPEKKLTKADKLIFLAIIVGTAFIVSALLYMTWSPIRGTYIEGIQGRYFIPIAPLFFLLVYDHKTKSKFFPRCFPPLVFAFVIFSMIVTAVTVYQRYYV